MKTSRSASQRSRRVGVTRLKIVLLSVGLGSLTGCETQPVTSVPGEGAQDDLRTVAYVRIRPAELKLGGAGDTATLRATALDSIWYDIPGKTFTWSVSDSQIAVVDSGGRVRALAHGSLAVAALVDGVAGAASVVIDVAYAAERACGQCHSSIYGEHVSLGLTLRECLTCHSVDVGEQGHPAPVNDHASVSGGFQLLAVHSSVPCVGCHEADRALRFSPADPSDCVACHQADYDERHAGSGYPTTCSSCHTPTVWGDGSFEHAVASGGFELLGVHAELACAGCHSDETFEPLYTPLDANDCVACHQADYDAQHSGSGYPTTCSSCHTPTAWSDATFDHDAQYFPIFSGEHQTRWQTCDVCHTNPNDFAEFTCFNCHAHNRTNMDNRHGSVSQYEYEPAECLRCHPDGTAP